MNRLTGSTRRLEVYPYDTLAYAYTYDTLGNLLKQSGPTKGEEDTYQYNDLNQMVSKHVCGYEQKLTRIYDYGYTYDKRGNLVKEEEVCSPTTTGDEFCAEKLLPANAPQNAMFIKNNGSPPQRICAKVEIFIRC